jgi:MtN3 and saliva related transmembrane protein
MSTVPVELLGTVAGTLTTVSFLPQAIKTLRTRSAGDLSLAMFSSFFVGVLLWVAYGVLAGAWSIILSNVITACLAGFILNMKVTHMIRLRRQREPG